MTTLFYVFLLVGSAALYALFAIGIFAPGEPRWWLVGAPFAYLGTVALLIVVWFALSWIWRAPPPPGARLSFGGHLRMLVREFATVASSWPVMVLHGWLIRDPQRKSGDMPVVLIHGVWNNDGVWLKFRRLLTQRGIGPIYTINYGPPMADIEHYAEQLRSRVNVICEATASPRVVLVGHSMGGLVARTYVRRHGSERVARLVTVGTPHHGSMLAHTAFGRCLEQMRPGNPWLLDLNRDEHGRTTALTVSIWSWQDTMVAPQTNARLAGAKNVALSGIAHNTLLRHRRIFARIVAEIEAARAAESARRPPM